MAPPVPRRERGIVSCLRATCAHPEACRNRCGTRSAAIGPGVAFIHNVNGATIMVANGRLRMRRIATLVALPALMVWSCANAIELDPKIIGFKLPSGLKWNENPRAGNRNVVLQGDPTKPGPYAVLMTWLPGNMSRPQFHPHDRHFIVVSGTWWVGAGPNYDRNATVPMPAGSYVIHHAKGIHYDGA